MHDATSPLSPGTRLGPYAIESLIGSGGMGAVYKARDTRLHRPVAIKRLTAHNERFVEEARAIAALNHPHICQIYDIGPDYLVLEYLHGEPVRGPLSSREATRFALQIADALEAAHGRGILHRDLKPANILIVRLQDDAAPTAKLLDFGVARLIDSDPDVTSTSAGTLVGTPAYMSPEQAEGRTLDVRSDVFSFGVVLYEMIAGRRAFDGDSVIGVFSAVLRDEPPALDAPAPLTRIVARCMEKNPARRFQNMREVKRALQALPEEDEQHRTSIAVLPFANLSPDKENEYFGDGLADEIINALAQSNDLKVIARTSAFAFKGRNEDVRQIAQTLGVTHVLEGSVRRAGARVRVTAQLVTAGDGSQLWSDRFDRPLTDMFEVQDEIAQAITAALKSKLARAVAARAHTPSLAAYEPFLRGRAQLIRFTHDAWNRAENYFAQAIALDPQYSEPRAELALGHFISGMHGMRPMREVAPAVRLEAEQALELNPNDERPRFLLGAVALAHDYDWEAAAAHFAASMHAANVPAHARWIYASLYLRGLARFEESSAEMARAVEQDPLNATWHAILGAHLIDVQRFDQAIAAALQATAIEPNYFVAQHLLGEAYWAAGRHDEAMRAFEHAYNLAPWNAVAVGWLAIAHARAGRQARADELIAQMGDAPAPMWGRVVYHLQTNDLNAAATWYERMIDQRDPFALVYARGAITQPLRDHHGWARLAALMRLPPATL